MLHKSRTHVIQPYKVGKNKSSLAMVIPVDVVRSFNIDPNSDILLLKVMGSNEIQLKIIKEQDLEKSN